MQSRIQNLEKTAMPEICRFFGIIIRMYFDEHNPPHLHAEYQGAKAVFDFNGNVLKGGLNSKTATKLVREWIDLYSIDLGKDWELARAGKKLNKISPLE
jgi:hypothetical protein